MADEPKFPAIEVPIDAETLKFRTIDKVKEFLEQETAAFSGMLDAPVNHPTAHQFLHDLRNRLRSARTQVKEATNTIEQIAREPNLSDDRRTQFQNALTRNATEIRGTLTAAYRQPRGLWLSRSATAQFLIEIAKTRPLAAAYAMLHLQEVEF